MGCERGGDRAQGRACPSWSPKVWRKAYGETRLLDGVDLSIHEGERVGLVGNNGSGKSTLARILVGDEQPDEGRVARRRGANIRYLPQEPTLPAGRSAREVVLEGLGAWAKAFERHQELSRLIASQEPGWEAYSEPQTAAAHEVERLGGWENSRRVDVLLQQLDLHEIDRSVDKMSGGRTTAGCARTAPGRRAHFGDSR